LSNSDMSGQPILILREGTERSRGSEAMHANIMAAKIVSDAIKSSLGPKGMDKMLVDNFGDITITNDGATMLKEMDIQHPAAKMMVEISKTQDDEVGDGTTSVVMLAGELLSKAEDLVEKKVHPTVIIDGYRKAASEALDVLEEIGIPVDPKNKDYLRSIAVTSMATKLVSGQAEHLAKIAVDAILQVAEEKDGKHDVDLDYVKLEKKIGESISDTNLIKGLVIDKEVVHSGMPKTVKDAKIGLLDAALEIEKTEFDSKLRIESPEEIRAFLDQEEQTFRGLVDKVKKAGINVLFCQKGIDDTVQHFLAREGVMAARRVKKSDMEALARATGAKIVTNVDELNTADSGYAKKVEEKKIADNKMIFVEDCRNPRAVSILIRGGTERITDETERSLHDALSVVKDVIVKPKILAGGGAPEIEVARRIRKFAGTVSGKESLAIKAFADAIETIPSTLAENAGMDPIDALSELQSRHEKGELWAGIDAEAGKVTDMKSQKVYEPMSIKTQMIKSASEAASMILKIDDVIASSKMRPPPKGGPGEEYGGGGMPPMPQ